MTPTPAPPYFQPVVCGTSVAAIFEKYQLPTYRGPGAENYSLSVVTDGPWAYVGWGIGETGGQSIYHHVDGRWCRVMNGGGAMNERDVQSVTGAARGSRLYHALMGNAR